MYQWLRETFQIDYPQAIERVQQLATVASDLGTTLPQLGLAWCLKNPNVSTVITGASKPDQVRENMKAGELVDRLDDGLMQRIEGILQNKPV
jgi:aryl-alcohol dehydrogenase-like predicted oxidoreductase